MIVAGPADPVAFMDFELPRLMQDEILVALPCPDPRRIEREPLAALVRDFDLPALPVLSQDTILAR